MSNNTEEPYITTTYKNEKSWYAMNAARKMPFVLKQLRQMHIYCWAPFHENPAADRCLMPLVLFRATEHEVHRLRADQLFPGFIYTALGAGSWTPIKIAMMEVRRFRTIRDLDNGQYRYFADEKKILEKGKPVKVIGGMFKGMEGYICRIKGSTSLYIHIPGICVVSIAYIPKSCLKGFDGLREQNKQNSHEALLKEEKILNLSDHYNQLPFSGFTPEEYTKNCILTNNEKQILLERLVELKEQCQKADIDYNDLYLSFDLNVWQEYLSTVQ